MAGIGEFYTFSDKELRAKFEKAAARGAELMVIVNYTSDGVPFGVAGIPMLLDTIDFHETAVTISRENAQADLEAALRPFADGVIKKAYDLSQDFKAAMQGTIAVLPDGALEAAVENLKAERREQALAARPWWKKLLGMAS